jgi:hypothetical protein
MLEPVIEPNALYRYHTISMYRYGPLIISVPGLKKLLLVVVGPGAARAVLPPGPRGSSPSPPAVRRLPGGHGEVQQVIQVALLRSRVQGRAQLSP